jgi:CBS domain-containing protein
MLARDVMSYPVVTVQTATTVFEATRVLIDNGFTAAPVIDGDGRLVGIITEADLLRGRITADPRRGGSSPSNRIGRHRLQTVADVMSTPVESLTAGADVADAARMMVDERIRCLPIVDGFQLVGVITRRDLLRVANRVGNQSSR